VSENLMRTQPEFTRSVALSTNFGAPTPQLLASTPRFRGGGRRVRLGRTIALSVIGAALGFAPAASAATNPPIPASIDVLPIQADWNSIVMELLRVLYELMGGDPRELDMADSVAMAMNIVRCHHETYGIPPNLGLFERIRLLQTALQLDVLMLTAPAEVDLHAVQLFQGTLADIIHELG
jgi:hypothetical protein